MLECSVTIIRQLTVYCYYMQRKHWYTWTHQNAKYYINTKKHGISM